jgi:hypothetical protein
MNTNRIGIPHVSFLTSLLAFGHFGAFSAASERFCFPPPGESNPASQRSRGLERTSDPDSVINESSNVPLWGLFETDLVLHMPVLRWHPRQKWEIHLCSSRRETRAVASRRSLAEVCQWRAILPPQLLFQRSV